jgi:hypothetical protein
MTPIATMVFALSSCFTGARPTLEPVDTIVMVDDPAASAVLDILGSTPTSTSFTVSYEIVTNFGGLTTLAVVAVDEILGTSVEIAETRYLFTAEGTTSTCSTTTFECVNGIDETRVSDRQLTSTFFKQSAIERIRQDTRVAVAPANGRQDSTIVDRTSVCADFSVVDSQGAARTKTYCALADYAVISAMETADLSVRAVAVEDSIDTARFQPPA